MSMIRLRIILLVMLSWSYGGSTAAAQSRPYGGDNVGTQLDSDPFLGDWQGKWSPEVTERDPQLVAQVIPRGSRKYEIHILAEFDKRALPYAVILARAEDNVIRFQQGDWAGEIRGDIFRGSGVFKGKRGSFQLKKVIRLAADLGAPPPEGAVVLFDGTSFDEWEPYGRQNDGTIKWELDRGVMRISTPRKSRHSLRTKRKFLDGRLHLEFRLPLQPENTGQARGNSGVMINSYEVQILDSYGLVGYYNECGALYKVAAPMVNMCAPPLQWQTYDINFRSARFDSAGKKISPARMTVRHNGKVIHRDQEIPHPTSNTQQGRLGLEPQGPGPISLQNHGHPVEFRNIWILPDAKR